MPRELLETRPSINQGRSLIADTREHLHDLIKDFRTAMLTTRTSDGGVHIRPMAVANLVKEEELFFATGLSTPKVDEIGQNNQIAVTFQSSSEFTTVYGTARVVNDRELVDELWSEAWRVLFPKGKEDPNLCLLAITAISAEYWDSSGLEGFKYLYEGLKADAARKGIFVMAPKKHQKSGDTVSWSSSQVRVIGKVVKNRPVRRRSKVTRSPHPRRSRNTL